MTLPFFYISEYNSLLKEIVLEEETSKHIVQVLRMKEGENLNLTDGKGNLMIAEIADPHKKHCSVKVIDSHLTSQASRKTTIAISLLKNTSRFEWFLEKATEIGVSEIIPLICQRTEKEKFRVERMNGILISAMLQSQQCWLPILHEPLKFDDLIIRQPARPAGGFDNYQKLIAHCDEGNKQAINNLHIDTSAHRLICIGPEGDFTKKEIEFALQNNFIPISLGDTRLRSETAGIMAAVLFSRV